MPQSLPVFAPAGYEFAAIGTRVIDALPDTARIEVEIGAWVNAHGSGSVAWLVVQPLAAEADRALRAQGIAEVRQALVASGYLRARLDVVVGDRRVSLDADGKGALAVGSMSMSAGAISYDGGMCDNPTDALCVLLRGLRLT